MRKSSVRVMSVLIVMGFVLAAPLASAAETTLPSYCKIEGVPLYQQIDAKGCGAVSLQMIFDFYGPFIDQREIYNAARSGGTTLPDMARAGQFSSLSTTAGDRWPNHIVTGYTGRSLGYAAFYYAADEPWLDELKNIVAQGYPVAVLVYWLPDYIGGDHYRVIVGYDDEEGVLLINDGWSREFKMDSDYQGSTSQMANPQAWDTEFGNFKMTYEDFITTWRCPTTRWGVPDKAYGAVLVTPWEIDLSVPDSLKPQKEFKIVATVKYPCVAPFGSPLFPTFDASDVSAHIQIGDGLRLVTEPEQNLPGGLKAGESATFEWILLGKKEGGSTEVKVTVSGLVSGSLGAWKDYPAYSYVDLIGGETSTVIQIAA